MSPMPAPKPHLTTSYALSGSGSLAGQDETLLLELKYLLSVRHTFQIDKESDLPTFSFVGAPILYKVTGFQETFKNFTFLRPLIHRKMCLKLIHHFQNLPESKELT